MTTLIMPVRARWDLAERALRSLASHDRLRIIVVDDDGHYEKKLPSWYESLGGALVAKAIEWKFSEEDVSYAPTYIANQENLGLWQSMNRGIDSLDSADPFCFFGCDVTFTEGWLPPLENALASLGGLGLVWPRDDHQDHGNASHFMTTKRWLWVIYGEERFPAGPGGYWHWYLDSELTCRSRDLGRALYVPESHVPHHWEPSPQGDGCWAGADDKATQDRRHIEWVNGGREAARERLAEALGAS